MVEELQAVAEETLDMAALDEVLDHHTSEEGALIAVLQEAQDLVLSAE